ncbi:MAG: hypothetical protein ACYS7Y_11740 [Planctomycetota bacterium]|jgi:hypothetical protein
MKHTEVPLGDHRMYDELLDETRLPKVDCEKCGDRFDTIPFLDLGICPKCQVAGHARLTYDELIVPDDDFLESP